jgi:hypothetical protein
MRITHKISLDYTLYERAGHVEEISAYCTDWFRYY